MSDLANTFTAIDIINYSVIIATKPFGLLNFIIAELLRHENKPASPPQQELLATTQSA